MLIVSIFANNSDTGEYFHDVARVDNIGDAYSILFDVCPLNEGWKDHDVEAKHESGRRIK